jgi:pSer/pThr/pTyr-binding forkhead associated (FHA) protein
VISCNTCGKENEDFFKFCLGCGAKLAGIEEPEASDLERDQPAEWPLHNTSPEEPGIALAEAEEPAQEDPSPETESSVEIKVPYEAPYTIESAKNDPEDEEVVYIGGRDEAVMMGGLPDPDNIVTVVRPSLESAETARQCRVCSAGIPMDFTFCALCGAPVSVRRQNTGPIPEEVGLAPSGETRGKVILLREDGVDRQAYDLDATTTILGREDSQIMFPSDEFLAQRHAAFTYRGDRLVVRPLETTNGVFRRLSGEVEIHSGDAFRIGQELLVFQSVDVLEEAGRAEDDSSTRWLGSALSPKVWGRLSQRIGPGLAANAFLLESDDVFLGRERGQITFPRDGYVSGCHAVVARRNGRVYLKDLGSSNGTYVRLRDEIELTTGDHLLVGQQLLRVEP